MSMSGRNDENCISDALFLVQTSVREWECEGFNKITVPYFLPQLIPLYANITWFNECYIRRLLWQWDSTVRPALIRGKRRKTLSLRNQRMKEFIASVQGHLILKHTLTFMMLERQWDTRESILNLIYSAVSRTQPGWAPAFKMRILQSSASALEADEFRETT